MIQPFEILFAHTVEHGFQRDLISHSVTFTCRDTINILLKGNVPVYECAIFFLTTLYFLNILSKYDQDMFFFSLYSSTFIKIHLYL